MNWEEYVVSWSHPPVDDVGYISARDMLTWSDFQLMDTITKMQAARYEGWRNHQGLWRKYLGLDLGGRKVLEYGCGVGMEAAELAVAGNSVYLADLSQDNIDLARRVIELTGSRTGTNMIGDFRIMAEWPFIMCPFGVFDTVNCSGVLHHIRKARLTMERFREMLRPGGEVRLMVYSDQGWRLATGSEPPPEPVAEDRHFDQFVRWMDGAGDYATWYDEAKIKRMFGDLFDVEDFAYLTPDNRYCAAVLRKVGE